MRWTPALILGGVLVGLAIGYFSRPDPDSLPRVAPEERILEQPVAAPTIKERIVYRQVPVESTTTITQIDTVVVREFVESVRDSADPIHLPYSLQYDGKALELWGTMSDGSRTYNSYDLRPTFRAGWAGDSTWAREERLARFPTIKVAGVAVAVAAVVACLALCK